MTKKQFKRCYALVIALLLAIIPCTFSYNLSFAEDSSQSQSSSLEDLDATLEEQIQNLDLSGLNDFFNQYCSDKLNFFGSSSLVDKIKQIINGDFGQEDTKSVLSGIANVFLEEIVSFLPLVSGIIALAVLASLITELNNKNSVSNVCHFVCFGAIIVLVMSAVVKMISLTSVTLAMLNTQMEVVFPILLTLLTACGGTVSVAVYQPAVAVLTSVVAKIFVGVLLPIFILSIIFTIISHISPSIKLSKLSSLCLTISKWIIGIVFTIFMGFLAIKGITAGSIDTVTFKTARYSLSTYIPIVGGYLSEGLNLILASCLLIKSAVGTCGLLILVSTIIVPVVQLILFSLALKFVGAVLEPLSDGRISNFISSLSKCFVLPIAMILAMAFMYVVFVGLIMCTSVGI